MRAVVEVRATTGWKTWLETQISILNVFEIQGLRVEFWVFIISDLRLVSSYKERHLWNVGFFFHRWRAAEAGRKATANTTWAAATTRGLWKLIRSRKGSPMTSGLSTFFFFLIFFLFSYIYLKKKNIVKSLTERYLHSLLTYRQTKIKIKMTVYRINK